MVKTTFFKQPLAGLQILVLGTLVHFACTGRPYYKTRSPSNVTLSTADSLRRHQVVTQAEGEQLQKIMNYPYLFIKFKQNDTEVEMVLDPLSTNLQLDLVHGADGSVQVMRGDSVLLEVDDPPPSDSLTNKIDKGNNLLDVENLTNEILRDITLAQKLFYEKRYEDALEVLQASLQKQETATAYALGGSIYYVNGDIANAVRAWENALKINPDLDNVRELVMRYKKSMN